MVAKEGPIRGNALLELPSRWSVLESVASVRRPLGIVAWFAATVAFRAGFRTTALSLMRRALGWRPEDVQLRYEYRPLSVEAGNIAEAEPHLRRLVDETGWVPARYLLGAVLQQLERHGDAVAQFREVLVREPGHPTVHYNLGVSLAALTRLSEAVDVFAEANRLQPDAPDIASRLGITYAQAGQPEAATIWLEKAVRLGGSCDDHINLGVNLLELGNKAEAEARFLAALDIRPESIAARLRLAYLLAGSDRFNEALAMPDVGRPGWCTRTLQGPELG